MGSMSHHAPTVGQNPPTLEFQELGPLNALRPILPTLEIGLVPNETRAHKTVGMSPLQQIVILSLLGTTFLPSLHDTAWPDPCMVRSGGRWGN